MTDTSGTVSRAKLIGSLKEAIDLSAAGRSDAAIALVESLVPQHGRDPDVLQVAGLVHGEAGDNTRAEDYYRRSLAVRPQQPHVRFNLGNLLRRAGRVEEAVSELREAVKLKWDYVDAHLLLGMALHDLRDFPAAETAYRNALRVRPDFLPALQCLGTVLNDREQYKDAELVLRQAIASASGDARQCAALEYNLAISLQKQNRHREALKFLDSAEKKVPTIPGLDYSRGNSLQLLGELEEAVKSYQKAVIRNPLDLAGHQELNELLYRQGDDARFLRSYDEAAVSYQNVGALPLAKGRQLILKGDYPAALTELRRASALLEKSSAAHDALGLVLARTGNFGDAIHEHEKAIKFGESDAGMWRNFGETLLRAGDAEKARTVLEKSMALNPNHQGAVALWSTALRLLGDPRGEAINDFENLVQVFDLDPPDGISDMAEFNAELNAALDKVHIDKREMLNQSLRGGTQTLENLFSRGHPLVDMLQKRIDEAVTAYIGGLKDDSRHPLLSRRTRDFAHAGSWSSRLHDCGFHANHFHHRGWISSAYYVDLPDSVINGNDQQGWLKFGEPAFPTELKAAAARAVQPKVGRLVLFPSYMWHGTVPFHADSARTTIAFDVVPR